MHGLCAGLTGVQLLKHPERSVVRALVPAILLHGTFDFVVRPSPRAGARARARVATSLSRAAQNMVIPFAITDEVLAVCLIGSLSIAILVAGAVYLRRSLRALPMQDMHTRYLQMLQSGELLDVQQEPRRVPGNAYMMPPPGGAPPPGMVPVYMYAAPPGGALPTVAAYPHPYGIPPNPALQPYPTVLVAASPAVVPVGVPVPATSAPLAPPASASTTPSAGGAQQE